MARMSANDQVALGSGLAFVLLAVLGFVFLSVTTGVVMLVLAIVWPLFYRAFFGRDGTAQDTRRG